MREGWQVTTLGNVCDVIGGGTPSKINSNFYKGDIPWATVRDMRNEVLSKTEFHISQEAVNRSSAKIIPGRNVVIATRVGLGRICLLEKDTAINQDLRGVVPKSKNIDVRFLFRWFQSIASQIEAEGTGATVKGVKLPFIKSLRLPLPSLLEQKRIVAILDEAFEGIDTATANTEMNLANARELFESYLNSLFSQGGDGWVDTSIGSQMTLQRGFDITKKDQNPGNVPVVSSGGIKSYHDTAKVESPGVVVGRKGSLGTVHFVEADYWPHDTTLWVKDFKCNNAKFVYYFLRSVDLKILDSGTANPALNRNLVHPIRMFWPAREVQESLVRFLDSLADDAQRLEDIYQQKITALAELKQSLLHKAFSGELTAERAEAAVEEPTA